MITETLPDGTVALRVDTPDLTINQVQIYTRGHDRRDTVLRYQGLCVACGKRTYSHDESNDDNAMIDNAEAGLTPDDYKLDPSLPSITACWPCMNDQDLYNKVVRKAESRWGLRPGSL